MKVLITIQPFEVEIDQKLEAPLTNEQAKALAERVYDRILDGVDYTWEPVGEEDEDR